jgi:hypothetical protein
MSGFVCRGFAPDQAAPTAGSPKRGLNIPDSFVACGYEILRRVGTFFAPSQTGRDLTMMDNMSQASGGG